MDGVTTQIFVTLASFCCGAWFLNPSKPAGGILFATLIALSPMLATFFRGLAARGDSGLWAVIGMYWTMIAMPCWIVFATAIFAMKSWQAAKSKAKVK